MRRQGKHGNMGYISRNYKKRAKHIYDTIIDPS